MVFQGSLRSDFQVFKMRFVGVLRVFQECLKVITMSFSGDFLDYLTGV